MAAGTIVVGLVVAATLGAADGIGKLAGGDAITRCESIVALADGRESTATSGLGFVDVEGIGVTEGTTTGDPAVLLIVLTPSEPTDALDSADCAGSAFFGAVKFETDEGRSSKIIPSLEFLFFSLTTGAAATALGSGIC
jgi:hypothetical protein